MPSSKSCCLCQGKKTGHFAQKKILLEFHKLTKYLAGADQVPRAGQRVPGKPSNGAAPGSRQWSHLPAPRRGQEGARQPAQGPGGEQEGEGGGRVQGQGGEGEGGLPPFQLPPLLP